MQKIFFWNLLLKSDSTAPETHLSSWLSLVVTKFTHELRVLSHARQLRVASPLFRFRIRKWAQSFVFCWYMIVYVFFRLYTSYFSTSLRGAGEMLSTPSLILDLKMGSIVCISLVHDCIRVFSFVHLFSTSLWGAGDMLPPFLILDSKMGSIVCISLVLDCIRLFSFVRRLLHYLSQGGWGHAIVPLFWFWIRKWTQLFVFR